MNFENTIYNSANKKIFRKRLFVKSAALSLSMLLGACASTGEQVETPKSEPKVDLPVKEKAEKQDGTSTSSASELMKSLKAPVVEPEDVVEQADAVQTSPRTDESAVATVESPEQSHADELQKEQEKKEEMVQESKTAVVEETKNVLKEVEEPKAKIEETAKGVSAKPFNVSAKKLPFTYDIWTIREGNTPLTEGLVIATPTWEMGKEGYTSQIWLTMMEDKIHVNSSSDIESASKGLGIRIDGGELIPFTEIADNNIAVISGQWLDKFAAANKIDIYLGFFPGKKPTSDTFVSDLSLKNFARMVATYRLLNN